MNKGRASLYVLAGGYLVYKAYNLFSNLSSVESSDVTIVWISIVCFAVFGAVILAIGLKDYMKITKEEKNASKKDNLISETKENSQKEKED